MAAQPQCLAGRQAPYLSFDSVILSLMHAMTCSTLAACHSAVQLLPGTFSAALLAYNEAVLSARLSKTLPDLH